MAERWVLPWLFNAQAAIVDWNRERDRRHYDGPVLDTGVAANLTQIRWLLHPVIGLPLAPFTVWRVDFGRGSLTDQEMANLPDWEPLELVGLPVDESWAETGYPLDDQGPLAALLPPSEAALQRLAVGAPRIGWDALEFQGDTLPDWEPSDIEGYLNDLLAGRLLSGLREMLVAQPDPLTHATFADKAEEDGELRLHPRLIGISSDEVGVSDRPARTEWRPLGLLAVGAGSDALASLALGFGTAIDHDNAEATFMVTVPHRITLDGQEFAFELAAIAPLLRQPRPPDPPARLNAVSIVRNRPEETDGPFHETAGVSWERPPHPRLPLQAPDAPYPASYAIGVFGPSTRGEMILLTRRPEGVGGWLPFVASRPEAARPEAAPSIRFADHIPLTTTMAGQVVAAVRPDTCTYGVATQDLFGRWSAWSTVSFDPQLEPVQLPTLLGVRLDPGGTLEVDFGWDWSDRSPQFIELSGAFEDESNVPLLAARFDFSTDGQPETGGFNLIPLDPNREPAADWGTDQDPPGEAPGLRFYRLRTTVPFSFNGLRSRIFAVKARGQRHIHHDFHPLVDISPFGQPVRTTVDDPAPPPPPAVPETPQWASLPDPSGVSRAVLAWPGDRSVAGYVLYEATETALLSALNLPGPDTAASLIDRLAVLRAADLPAHRNVFRRVREELILPVTPVTSFEVALPRGSSVLHFYAVTAMSHNQVESNWPTNAKQFIAVAAPRLLIPAAPILEATADPPHVRLRLQPGRGPAPSRIEIYRTANQSLEVDVDAMGPSIATVTVNGAELGFDDETAPPGWRHLWYRAVGWSADDAQAGLIAARSPASAAVSVLLPPVDPPAIDNLLINQPGSTDAECLISWESDVPVSLTPLGPHTAVVETSDAAGNTVVRLEGRLEALPSIANPAAVPPPDPENRTIFRLEAPSAAPRFFAWVPRPAADQPFHLTVKKFDPLGRIGRAEVEVPPLPLTPVLGPVAITPLPPPIFPPPGRLSVAWDIPMAIPPGMLSEYTLTVVGPGGIDRQGLLSQVAEVANPAEFTAIGQVRRTAGQQSYFLLLPFTTQPVQVVVTLTDSVGRSVTEIGTHP